MGFVNRFHESTKYVAICLSKHCQAHRSRIKIFVSNSFFDFVNLNLSKISPKLWYETFDTLNWKGPSRRDDWYMKKKNRACMGWDFWLGYFINYYYSVIKIRIFFLFQFEIWLQIWLGLFAFISTFHYYILWLTEKCLLSEWKKISFNLRLISLITYHKLVPFDSYYRNGWNVCLKINDDQKTFKCLVGIF